MKAVTVTHYAYTYEGTALILLSLGSFTLANHMYARWGKESSGCLSFMAVHVWVKGFIVVFGFLIVSPAQLFPVNSFSLQLLSVPIGIASGWTMVYLERRLSRFYYRRQFSSGSTAAYRTPVPGEHLRSLRGRRVVVSSTRRISPLHRFNLKPTVTPRANCIDLSLVTLVAIFEEIIFRGFLVHACQSLPNGPLLAACLSGTVVAFGLSHVSLGWHQFAAKTALGMITLSVTLLTNSLVAAIIAHIFLNVSAWKETTSLSTIRTKSS